MVKVPRTASQIRLDEDIHIKAKIIADKELRSMNAQLEYFILKGIETYEEQHGEIENIFGTMEELPFE